MKTEYEIWSEEITRERLTIAQRVAKWFDRPASEPEIKEPRDVYEWVSVAEMMERGR